jgi:hypothetical protein
LQQDSRLEEHDSLQLATIKAKSEAVRLRQQFELQKFRKKYSSTASDANVTGQQERLQGGAEQNGGSSDAEGSESSLSIGSAEAFDEPLKVWPC